MKTRIGVTERGDAGLDLSWQNTDNPGLLLITKNINQKFREAVLETFKQKPIILHATCTGFGGTWLEPNVPDYKTQLDNLKLLINSGFPIENVVLRIDPIFPTEDGGFKAVKTVLDYAKRIGVLTKKVRISLCDMYPHVKQRWQAAGHTLPYQTFYAPDSMIEQAAKYLQAWALEFNIEFVTCAEDTLVAKANELFGDPNDIIPGESRIRVKGCISREDLKIMNLERLYVSAENAQRRNMCHCMAIKEEVLTNKCRCPHGCLYCFWKD